MSDRHSDDNDFSAKAILQLDTSDEDSRGEKRQKVVKRSPKRLPGIPAVWATRLGQTIAKCRARKK
jgi:hypothetical protein